MVKEKMTGGNREHGRRKKNCATKIKIAVFISLRLKAGDVRPFIYTLHLTFVPKKLMKSRTKLTMSHSIRIGHPATMWLSLWNSDGVPIKLGRIVLFVIWFVSKSKSIVCILRRIPRNKKEVISNRKMNRIIWHDLP